MSYIPTLNAFLQSASQLLAAYPTARIATRYSLPSSKPQPDPQPATTSADVPTKREPAATLTVKVYHPHTGLILKYRTDKAQEVGRLVTSLGRLARGEELDATPAATAGAEAEKMDVDEVEGAVAGKVGATQPPSATAGGGGKKKKKGKK
jgi:hypothetical protein